MTCSICGRRTRHNQVCKYCEKASLGTMRKPRECALPGCSTVFQQPRVGRPAILCPEHRVSWVYHRRCRGIG